MWITHMCVYTDISGYIYLWYRSMEKSKIQISARVLDAISRSSLTEKEKINILKYVGYMTQSEQQELMLSL